MARTAGRAAIGTCALWILAGLAGCEGALGTSPPHAAPSNPTAEGEDGAVVLTWGAVTDASRYLILWDTEGSAEPFGNRITDIQGTTYTHAGLENLVRHRYRIVAETSGGRGPESLTVSAVPGPVPGTVDWAVVTAQDPGHTIHFAPATGATHYRVYFASLESQLAGRRPAALFEEADGPPFVREDVTITSAIYYRVIAMNDTRIGTGGPVVVSPGAIISEHDLPVAGIAFGTTDDDSCLDLPTATGGSSTGSCGTYTARDLEDAGLEDLNADPRRVADVRLADFDGDGLDDLLSNTNSSVNVEGSVALLHLNQDEDVFQSSAAVAALGIGGVGGTLLVADLDNDGDLDAFLPNDQSRGGGARNWLLVNDGTGSFADTAASAGLAVDPPGAAYIPRGGQAVDFDEDGLVDLVFGSRLMLNNGDGSFRDGSAAVNWPVLEDNGLKLIDVDLDGDLDLIHHSGTETRLYRNLVGVFDGGELVGVEDVATYGYGLTVCDVNGDGYEDVVVARNSTETNRGTPKLLINVVGSLMPSATQEGTTADPNLLVARNERLACGDQNGDGLSDVLARWGESYRLLRGGAALSGRIRLRIVGVDGERNQQGRVVRVAPRSAPGHVMTRVVDGGSGLRAQNMYDVLVGAPWSGTYDVTVRFADGEFTTTAEPGDELLIFADGVVEEIDPDAGA